MLTENTERTDDIADLVSFSGFQVLSYYIYTHIYIYIYIYIYVYCTHSILHSEEATRSTTPLNVRDAVVKYVEELVALVIHLLAYTATLGSQHVTQVHHVNGRTCFLVQL